MSAAAKPMALATVPREVSPAIEPVNMGELQQLAASAGKTGFFGAKTPEQALLVMMSGRDLGLSYAQSLRAFHVIENKPSLSADGMVAVALVRRDVCEYFKTIEVTNDHATVETKRTGQEAQRYTFTMADAQRAGVATKANWQKYPSRMLLARARSSLARDVYPDLLMGLYDPDEEESTPRVVEAEVVQSVGPNTATVVKAAPAAPPVVDADEQRVALEQVTAFTTLLRACTTTAEVKAIGKRIADEVKVKSARTALGPEYKAATEAVKVHELAKAEADRAFDGFEQPREREPGEEG